MNDHLWSLERDGLLYEEKFAILETKYCKENVHLMVINFIFLGFNYIHLKILKPSFCSLTIHSLHR